VRSWAHPPTAEQPGVTKCGGADAKLGDGVPDGRVHGEIVDGGTAAPVQCGRYEIAGPMWPSGLVVLDTAIELVQD